ncbi:hypothetical protein G7054_g13373 [Neopestalotiopsis clavispora]|nr:hypothetical protein G7054_g13373 [Neopestalotiopsis clavispora]
MEPRKTAAARSYGLQIEARRSPDMLSERLAIAALEEQKNIDNRQSTQTEWTGWLQCGESFSDEDCERLNNKCKEAVKLWKELCQRSHNGSDLEVFTIPTLEQSSAATNKMMSTRKSNHESGFQAAKDSFLNFVNVMSDYAYIFSVFPSGDKYTSVITGVLSTIAKNMPKQIVADLCDQFVDKIGKLGVGVTAGAYLGSVEEHITHDQDRALLGLDSDHLIPSQLAKTSPTVEADQCQAPVIVGTEPSAAIDQLAPFIDDGRGYLMNEQGALTKPNLPEEVVIKMQDWIRDPTSRMLWVEGVEVYSGPLFSMTALYIHSTIEATGVPCVSHFCRYPFRFNSDLSSGEALFIFLCIFYHHPTVGDGGQSQH